MCTLLLYSYYNMTFFKGTSTVVHRYLTKNVFKKIFHFSRDLSLQKCTLLMYCNVHVIIIQHGKLDILRCFLIILCVITYHRKWSQWHETQSEHVAWWEEYVKEVNCCKLYLILWRFRWYIFDSISKKYHHFFFFLILWYRGYTWYRPTQNVNCKMLQQMGYTGMFCYITKMFEQ